MRFSNWFRIVWWAALQTTLVAYLWNRWSELIAGRANVADVVVFLVLMALALAPIYDDIGILGVNVKQHVKKLEDDISGLRSEIRNAIDVKNSFSPSINFGQPLTPEKLKDLAEDVRKRAKPERTAITPPEPPDDATAMFKIRFDIEREIRRIHDIIFTPGETDVSLPVDRLARNLAEHGLISREVASAIEQIYRITSRSIHGKEISRSQAAFATDVSGWILAELRSL